MAVHGNPEFTDIEYLKSILVKGALDGLITIVNYKNTVALLKERFSSKETIIAKHMEALLGFKPVIHQCGFRESHDTVETHQGIKGTWSGSRGLQLFAAICIN